MKNISRIGQYNVLSDRNSYLSPRQRFVLFSFFQMKQVLLSCHGTTILSVPARAPVVAQGRVMKSLFIKSNSSMLGKSKQLTEIL